MTGTELALKSISKDLHEISGTLKNIDRRLALLEQAPVFKQDTASYKYIPDCPSREPLNLDDVYPTMDPENSQNNHTL